jgi:predicted kinase
MEAVIFVGIQATGKSSFYIARFFQTHIRINLDMLRTRRRETLLLRACIEMQQRFVVDNTNPTLAERANYITPAKAAGFRVVGYYFPAVLGECIQRNNRRSGKQIVPIKGIVGTLKRLVPPSYAEGFDALYTVRIAEPDRFSVEEWPAAP